MMIMAYARTHDFEPVFHFNPEANVGDGTTPNRISDDETDLLRTTVPESMSTPPPEGDTETVPAGMAH